MLLSKQMAPAYEEAAKKLGEEASPIVLAKVDSPVCWYVRQCGGVYFALNWVSVP